MKYFAIRFLLPFLLLSEYCNAMHTTEPLIDSTFTLEYIVRPARDTSRPAPLLILLHGYGSDENDLFSLSDRIPAQWMVLSVRAPMAISTNQFKWYDVRLINERIVVNSDDAAKSRQLILHLIDQLVDEEQVLGGQVVVAGFSQGGNMALSLAVTEPEKVWAAACFSGRILEEVKSLAEKREVLHARRVFIGHGTEDRMLPLRYAEESHEFLQGLGMEVTVITDTIGHSISSKELDAFVLWLNQLTFSR